MLRLSLSLVLIAFTSPALPTNRDPHSFANPEHIRVTHVDLDLKVDFDKQVIDGVALLSVERTSADKMQPLILDTRGLTIESVETSTDTKAFLKASFTLDKETAILGGKLSVELPEDAKFVRIAYKTGPKSTALQWLTPKQTAGKKHPYLFTQSQAIDARSWMPIQDTPGVRVTYAARVRTPKELVAVMSAGNDPEAKRNGDYRFEMKQPIPAYLIALAVGDIDFRKVGPRTGVYAEPSVVMKAANEFSELEEMMRAAERLFGPYRWNRYDVLVMPPSFPYGGMENPRLTFASPTVLAGDKSLVSLLAHELSHSWSGNLVTNATWGDFWLNEGFTVYLERRIMEEVYGKARADAEAMLGRRSLEREMKDLPEADQVLHINLTGREPIDGLTDVPYEKGYLFLRHLEAIYGRAAFDSFLKKYFDHFAFKSITTDAFADYLKERLLKGDPEKAKRVNLDRWLHRPGLPSDAPNPAAEALNKAEDLAKQFGAGKIKANDLATNGWTPQQWFHFLASLPETASAEQLKELDDRFKLTATGNSEVLFQWLFVSLKSGYGATDKRLEEFLTQQGRRRFLEPLYKELAKTESGRRRAAAIYEVARPTYHPISIETIDQVLGWKKMP